MDQSESFSAPTLETASMARLGLAAGLMILFPTIVIAAIFADASDGSMSLRVNRGPRFEITGGQLKVFSVLLAGVWISFASTSTTILLRRSPKVPFAFALLLIFASVGYAVHCRPH